MSLLVKFSYFNCRTQLWLYSSAKCTSYFRSPCDGRQRHCLASSVKDARTIEVPKVLNKIAKLKSLENEHVNLKYWFTFISGTVFAYLLWKKSNSNQMSEFFSSSGISYTVHAAIVEDESKNEVSDTKVQNKYKSFSKQFNFIADVVEKAAPAVVNIDIPMRFSYMTGQKSMGNGSGFIVRSDGLILTNAHVVAGQNQVVVRLKDGAEYAGTVQAVDPVADLATVSINATNLPVLRMGQSRALRPGEFVIAMGSPLALSNTVTAGIVSSADRGSQELGLDKNMSYIQTDAHITHGNSGGPLINLDGEAVGINTMKVTAGISFAIPADYAVNFLERVKSEPARGSSGPVRVGSPRYKYIGVSMLSLTPSLAADLQGRVDGISLSTRGILVYRVVVDSPAHRAGLLPGDVITHINGRQVNTSGELFGLVRSETKLDCSVLRKGKTLHVSVVPEAVH